MSFLLYILAAGTLAKYLFVVAKIMVGAHLGMALLIAVKAAIIRQGSKYQLGFREAVKVYVFKYTGPLVVGEVVVFITCWILPNLMGNSIINGIEEHSKQYAKWVIWAVNNIETSSVLLGTIASGLGFSVIRNGSKYFQEAEEQKLQKSAPPDQSNQSQ